MSNLKNLMRLDFATVKPYITIKNTLIYLLVVLALIYSNQSVYTGAAMLLMFISIIATYPFVVGEQNDLDSLYTIMGVKRKDVVFGRYAFMLVFDIIGILLVLLLSITLSFILSLPLDYHQLFTTIGVITVIFMVVQFIQYPIFFKMGYMKAKLISYLPYIFITVIFLIVANLAEQLDSSPTFTYIKELLIQIGNNPLVFGIIMIIILLILLYVSFLVSKKFYGQREF